MFARPRPCMAAVHSSPLLGILKKTRRRRVWGLSPARLPRPLPCPPPRGFPLAAFLISVISVHKLLVITHTCQSLCRGTPERCSLEVCLTPPIDSHSPAQGVLQGPCACVCVCTPARGVLQGRCACVCVCTPAWGVLPEDKTSELSLKKHKCTVSVAESESPGSPFRLHAELATGSRWERAGLPSGEGATAGA